eukprot:7377724-Prymnesium_polylepis.1
MAARGVGVSAAALIAERWYGGWADEYVTFPRERSPPGRPAAVTADRTDTNRTARAQCTVKVRRAGSNLEPRATALSCEHSSAVNCHVRLALRQSSRGRSGAHGKLTRCLSGLSKM